MDDRLEQLSASLAAAWREGTTIPVPPQPLASRSEAYAVQDRMADLIGGPVAGWKVGATAKSVQLLEGHDGPILGRIFRDRLFESPAIMSAPGFSGVKAECEFAFQFAADVPARPTRYRREEIEPVLVLHPAIEIIGSRYAPNGPRSPRTFDTIADNGNASALVVGPGIPGWRSLDLAGLPIEGRLEGGPQITAYEGEYRLDPVEAVIDTLEALAARGIGFAAGQYLSTGSLTLPAPVRQGMGVAARFGKIATVEVRLT